MLPSARTYFICLIFGMILFMVKLTKTIVSMKQLVRMHYQIVLNISKNMFFLKSQCLVKIMG